VDTDQIAKAERKAIGQRIRAYRVRQDLSLNDLGQSIEVSPQMIHKYETGVSPVPSDRLARLANRLKVSCNDLIPTAILGTQSSIELSEDEHQLLKSFRAIGDRKVKRNLVQFLDSVVTQTILSQKADQTN
jgi:transcriptional regulator with XRE-family HTH domain